MRRTWMSAAATLLVCGTAAAQAALQVEDVSGPVFRRKIVVTSPGVFKAEVWQSSGGGIMKFWDLAQDPEEKVNLAGWDRGLFEVGWHGAGFKGPDREDCCAKHIRNKTRFVKDEKTGEMVRDQCYDGCGDWPSAGHKTLKAMGELEVIEQTPARVRVRVKAPFVWWSSYVHKLEAAASYTFYPTGTIVIQVRITNADERPFHWSGEFGPHLFLPSSKEDQPVPDFILGTPKYADYTKDTKDLWPRPAAEELAMAWHPDRKTSLFITIPPEAHKTFGRHMRHTFKGTWDRYGYGSGGVVMPPGYDDTWACMIQLCSVGGKSAPPVNTPTAALPFALEYREPAKITGATLVTDDPGDFNKDGYNESEGCHVFRGPGPLAFTYEKGKGAGFCPAFKVVGWAGEAPKTVKIDGKAVEAASGVVDGKLILQVLGTVAAEKAGIEIAR